MGHILSKSRAAVIRGRDHFIQGGLENWQVLGDQRKSGFFPICTGLFGRSKEVAQIGVSVTRLIDEPAISKNCRYHFDFIYYFTQ